MNKILLFVQILVFLAFSSAFAGQKQPQSLKANRIENKAKPKIDGLLEEDAWKSNPQFFSGNFIQNRPKNGAEASQKTEIQIIYDDFAIYIAARLYDTHPDSILHEIGQRDGFDLNTDMFSVSFDTYNKQQNAFTFSVSAAGTQGDAFVTPNGEDTNWNAVWNSATRIDDLGWVVEIEIPYSALRFPKQEIQTWGVNFMRLIQRRREQSFWNFVDASVNGFVNQFGVLTGLKNIEPPLRLAFMPYISSYANFTPDGHFQRSINGGMDLKWGLNESYTLDMSLIPDFGQVRSDNVVLNLTPFEVQFAENRPFFTEGTELFNKPTVFYSRRVGKSFGRVNLGENEEIIQKNHEAQLLNATKISGRSKNGLGIGFFNALTDQTYATIQNTETGETRTEKIDPLTNFNMLVFDKNLKNNSNLSFYNTNVFRVGGNHANVTGGDFVFNDKKNTYFVSGRLNISQLYKRKSEGGYSSDIGHNYQIMLGKQSGNFQFSASRYVESYNYNPNDLGFLQNPNEVTHRANVSYNIFKPVWKINRFYANLSMRHQKLHQPDKFVNVNFNVEAWTVFKNFWEIYAFGNLEPVDNYDYFSPRTTGYQFVRLPSHNAGIWWTSDGRKRFRFSMETGFWTRPDMGQFDNWVSINPRFRVSDKLSFDLNANYLIVRKERDFATKQYDQNNELKNVIYGKRNRTELDAVFNTTYSFSPLMNLSLRIRHYWSTVKYTEFYNLAKEGTLQETDYQGFTADGNSEHNTNFNAFNIDLVYSWQVAPGSFLSVVWKDAIYTNQNRLEYNYIHNLRNTISAPQTNNLSVRLIYFLDYLLIKKKFTKS